MFRSLLFTPADQPARIAKAFAAGADAVIVDLEDAVAPSMKAVAREGLARAVPRLRPCPAYIRVNAADTPHCLADIEAAVAVRADGIMLPKTRGPEHVVAVAWALDQIEAREGASRIPIVPVVETAAGLARAEALLTSSERVVCAGFGGADFTLDLGLSLSDDGAELIPYRAALVVASRAAGCAAPLDAVYGKVRDLDGLRREAEAARRMGFQGKRCIHPDQVAVINAAFAPTTREIDFARRALDAFASALANGSGGAVVDGRFVDAPVAADARRLLARVPAAPTDPQT